MSPERSSMWGISGSIAVTASMWCILCVWPLRRLEHWTDLVMPMLVVVTPKILIQFDQWYVGTNTVIKLKLPEPLAKYVLEDRGIQNNYKKIHQMRQTYFLQLINLVELIDIETSESFTVSLWRHFCSFDRVCWWYNELDTPKIYENIGELLSAL